MSTDVAASSRRRQGLLMQTAFKLETVQVSNDAASKAFLSRGAFATKGQSSSHWSERRADMRREIQVTSNTSTVRYFFHFFLCLVSSSFFVIFPHDWRCALSPPAHPRVILFWAKDAALSFQPFPLPECRHLASQSPPLTRAYAAASASLSSTSSSSVTSLSSPTFHLDMPTSHILFGPHPSTPHSLKSFHIIRKSVKKYRKIWDNWSILVKLPTLLTS